MNTMIRMALAGFLALPLAAKDGDLSLGGGAILALDGLKKVTNASLGFALTGGYETTFYKSDVPLRLSATLAFMPGTAQDYSLRSGSLTASGSLKTSLTAFQVSGDLLITTSIPALRGLAGISITNYSMSTSGTEDARPEFAGYAAAHFPLKDAKGLKLGLRVGLEYRFTDTLTGEVLLQQTELGGKQKTDPLVRAGGINPAWLQLGVRYMF